MEKEIRVLHVLQRMEAGGTQALLMNLYRNIEREKIQFDFLVEYPNKEFYDDEIISLGGKIYYSNIRQDKNVIEFERKLQKIIKENNYKIIHVHTYSIGYFVLKTAKKSGVPIRIAHSHSNNMTNDFKKYFKIILQKLYPIYATNFIACSDEAGKYLFKNKKFEILNNAIDSKKFIFSKETRCEIRKELGLSDKFVVGHVGRFKPEKNHLFLINIFFEIKKQLPDAKLLMIGNGDSSQEITERIRELSIQNDVIILKNRKDINKLYQAMDVFVFPSIYEGLGIVAIEAQASGIPCVCSTGLPKESKITNLYTRLSLNESAKKWANVAIESSKNKLAFTNTQKYVIKANYDIKMEAEKLENYYIDLYNEAIMRENYENNKNY